MLTPSFHLSQTDELLIVTIHAPYTQLNDVEINALECEFWFHSAPYFLRLTFPHAVVDDDEPPTSFDADKGDFEIRLRKKEVGQYFPNLDLLGTLLAPKKQQNIKPKIEVLSGETEEMDEDADEDEDEWLIDQELCTPEPDCLLNAPRYGFGNLTQGVFHKLKSEFKEIIDLADPDGTPSSERETLRRAEEDTAFCSDHYLADFMEPHVMAEHMAYTPTWLSQQSDKVKLTAEEKECLKKLGNKEFLLSKEEKQAAWLSLVDILFAYAYNHRTCLGENTVESAWTINKLSATLSWFATYTSVHQVVISCFRRLLTYSLYRNWDLAQLVFKDTIAILKSGRRQVLRCMLEVHSLFSHSELCYLLNQLYISDYCIWLQKVSDRKLDKFTNMLEQVTISKTDVGFDLEELEHAAMLVQEEALAEQMIQIDLNDYSESSSSDDSSDSDSSSSGSSTLTEVLISSKY